jgi:hypothetical protein
MPSHPVAAAVAGFASHFAIDAIPHCNYPLRSIAIGKRANNRRMQLSRGFIFDLLLIGTDACVGLGLSILLFASSSTALTICVGAIAGMLPDALQFAYSLYPHGPLAALQRFHRWVHTKRKLGYVLGASSQIAFVAIVSAIAITLA